MCLDFKQKAIVRYVDGKISQYINKNQQRKVGYIIFKITEQCYVKTIDANLFCWFPFTPFG